MVDFKPGEELYCLGVNLSGDPVMPAVICGTFIRNVGKVVYIQTRGGGVDSVMLGDVYRCPEDALRAVIDLKNEKIGMDWRKMQSNPKWQIFFTLLLQPRMQDEKVVIALSRGSLIGEEDKFKSPLFDRIDYGLILKNKEEETYYMEFMAWVSLQRKMSIGGSVMFTVTDDPQYIAEAVRPMQERWESLGQPPITQKITHLACERITEFALGIKKHTNWEPPTQEYIDHLLSDGESILIPNY